MDIAVHTLLSQLFVLSFTLSVCARRAFFDAYRYIIIGVGNIILVTGCLAQPRLVFVTNFAVFQAVIICIVKLRTALDTLAVIREWARARPRFLFAVPSIF